MRLFRNVDLHAELDKLADRGEQERLLTEALQHLNDVVAEEQADPHLPSHSLPWPM